MGSFPETYKGGFVQFFARSKIYPDRCKHGLSDDVFFYNKDFTVPIEKENYLFSKKIS